ncbi:M24 protein [Murid betaherpesvirus 1]|nr:M24 protein [Murid betaherpesvirus 1]
MDSTGKIGSRFDAACEPLVDDAEATVSDVLYELAHAAGRGSLELREKLFLFAGGNLRMAWPAGAVITFVPDIQGWEPQSGRRNRVLRYFCCDVFVYPIGYASGLKVADDTLVLVDVFGRFYCYRGPPDDAIYYLAASPEQFSVIGFRYFYPIHCTAGPIEIGLLLSRLWMMIRRGADADAVCRFVVRAHGETVVVARRLVGRREVLRVCSLGCSRWRKRDSSGRLHGYVPCPPPLGEYSTVPLGRVKKGLPQDPGIAVFVGLPSGRVYARQAGDSSYYLVADSIPGFVGIGATRYFENRRFGLISERDSGRNCERPPPRLSEF